MTPSELDLLVKLIDNNHADSMRRLDALVASVTQLDVRMDGFDARMDGFESKQLAPEDVRKVRSAAVRMDAAASTVRWIAGRRALFLSLLPMTGVAGVVYWLLERIP